MISYADRSVCFGEMNENKHSVKIKTITHKRDPNL